MIAEAGRTAGGIHDVGHEHGGEGAVESRARAHPGEKLLDLVEDERGIARVEREGVGLVQFHRAAAILTLPSSESRARVPTTTPGPITVSPRAGDDERLAWVRSSPGGNGARARPGSGPLQPVLAIICPWLST